MLKKNYATRLYNAREIQIYTDGGCQPNPGAGGFGVVILDGANVSEFYGSFNLTTNNRMEIYAAIFALKKLGDRPCRATLHSDSQYLVRAIDEGWAKRWKKNGWWRTRTSKAENHDLWERLLQLLEIHTVKFVWVKGHSGNAWNERCDQLAAKGRAMASRPRDEGYRDSVRSGSFQMQLNFAKPEKTTKKWWAIVEVEGKKETEFVIRYIEAEWSMVDKIVSGTQLVFKSFPSKESAEAWVKDVLPGQMREKERRERFAKTNDFQFVNWARQNINTKYHRRR